MPGMMDTVLNLGLNDESVEGLAARPATRASPGTPTGGSCRCSATSSAACPARASRRRSRGSRRERGVTLDTELDADALRELTRRFQALYDFPTRPARAAAAGDPRGLRLLDGRPRGRLPAHQRHPRRLGHRRQRAADGLRQQGPDLGLGRGVLARRGHRRARAERRLPASTPRARTSSPACAPRATSPSSRDWMPEAHAQLLEILRTLERHYGDMQDTEFTVEEGRLYMLQTRSAKRPAQAAVRFAVDAVEEGLLTPRAGDRDDRRRLAGRAAAPDLRPGRAVRGRGPRRGRVAGRGQGRRSCSPPPTRSRPPRTGRDVILVRPFTEADDVAGFHAAQGHPDLRGRQGLARRARRPRHGPPGGHGRRRASRSTCTPARCAIGERVLREGDLIAIDGTHRRRSPSTTCRS